MEIGMTFEVDEVVNSYEVLLVLHSDIPPKQQQAVPALAITYHILLITYHL